MSTNNNIVLCLYFDEYDTTAYESGLFINSTKYLISKLKYYKKIYKEDFQLLQYYIIDKDCYTVLNNFKQEYKKINKSFCYDMIYVNFEIIEKYFDKHNIKYTIVYPDSELIDMIDEPMSDIEFKNLLTEIDEI